MKTFNHTHFKNKGYTLLLAVLVSSLVLAIGISILTISKKEFLLATSARDSSAAFYAADGAVECAAYADRVNDAFSTTSDNIYNTVCNLTMGNIIGKNTSPSAIQADNSGIFSFDVLVGDNLALSCARVQVVKKYDKVTGNLTTTISARGYNVGWNSTSPVSCDVPSAKKVERGFQLSY